MSSGITDIPSRALAAYGVNQVGNVHAGPSAASSVMTAKQGGMPRITDTVELSDKAYDLLLTPGNYRPNVKAAPVEGQMTKTMINLVA
jgi:hypothetical protein